MTRTLKTAVIGLIVFLAFFTLGAGAPLILSEFYQLNLKDWSYRAPAQTTIYTSDGKVLMHFGYEREYKDDFPELLKRAVVEVEDRRFYSHGSIDPLGMLRALWVDIRQGEKAQGGSTITQQLARTLFLTNKKSLMRKSKEIVIATALERKYSKDEILNMYLNELYMGRGVCGMGAAAEKYFGKDVSELSLAEISCLVAMISAPEYYSPDHDYKALKIRQAVVLNVLSERGVISREQASQALSQRLNVLPDQPKKLQHPYFTVYILGCLKKEYGEDAVYRGGLKVYTTLDSKMQNAAEKTTGYHMRRLAPQGITARDVALVSVEPGTGAVKALVGGADFSRNQINMALVPRQPGSAIKPLIYAAAMEEGLINDRTVLNNRPRNFNGYRPSNSTGNPARASVREALVRSYNVAAVEVLNRLGVGKAIQYLERFGISTLTRGDAHLAMALGGLEKGISPLEMASAYASLADDGKWAEPYMIAKIEAADGTIMYEHEVNSRRVVSRDVARAMTSILQDVVRYGTGSSARIRVPAAGKTGTTTDSRDLWFVGYTQSLSTAVWLGNSNNDAIRGVATYGGTRCGPIWRDYMNALLDKGLIAGGLETYNPYDKWQQETPAPNEQAPEQTPPSENPEAPPVPEQQPGPTPGENPPGEPTEPGTAPEPQPDTPPGTSPDNGLPPVTLPVNPPALDLKGPTPMGGAQAL